MQKIVSRQIKFNPCRCLENTSKQDMEVTRMKKCYVDLELIARRRSIKMDFILKIM